MESAEQVGDFAVDVLRAVVGVEGLDGEGEGGDEVLQHGDHEVLADARNGSKVLELRDFVDHVDHAGPLPAVPLAAVDRVDAHEARLAQRARPAPRSDPRRRHLGSVQGGPCPPVGPASPEVVDVAVGDPRQALEALVAEHMKQAPQDPLRRGSRELAEGLVHLGQQGGVGGRVDGREGPGGRTQPVVADVARAALLGDQPGQLRVGVAGELGEELPDQALSRPRQAEVVGCRRGCGSARCRVSRSCSHDLLAPPLRLTSRWKSDPRLCSFLVGQRSALMTVMQTVSFSSLPGKEPPGSGRLGCSRETRSRGRGAPEP